MKTIAESTYCVCGRPAYDGHMLEHIMSYAWSAGLLHETQNAGEAGK